MFHGLRGMWRKGYKKNPFDMILFNLQATSPKSELHGVENIWPVWFAL